MKKFKVKVTPNVSIYVWAKDEQLTRFQVSLMETSYTILGIEECNDEPPAGQLIDRAAAQAELDALSVNAKRFLADTLGNPLHAARLTAELSHHMNAGIDQLVERITAIRLFTTDK